MKITVNGKEIRYTATVVKTERTRTGANRYILSITSGTVLTDYEIEKIGDQIEYQLKEPETTTVKLPPYRHKDGCIKVCYSCEKCGYEHEHFDYNFCPDCGRKIERSDKE